MQFGVVGWVGRWMGVFDRGGDRRRGSFEVNAVHPIVTNWDAVA